MLSAEEYISKLNLVPHPEGGFYKETYRDSNLISVTGFEGKRNISTAIYFLLKDDNKSHFHKIKSDELWFYHDGNALEIFILTEKGLDTIVLGKNINEGEVLQAVVPANTWFASKVKNNNGFVLVSCTVAPGFSFNDFEMATKGNLKNAFPTQIDIIDLMTLD